MVGEERMDFEPQIWSNTKHIAILEIIQCQEVVSFSRSCEFFLNLSNTRGCEEGLS